MVDQQRLKRSHRTLSIKGTSIRESETTTEGPKPKGFLPQSWGVGRREETRRNSSRIENSFESETSIGNSSLRGSLGVTDTQVHWKLPFFLLYSLTYLNLEKKKKKKLVRRSVFCFNRKTVLTNSELIGRSMVHRETRHYWQKILRRLKH